MIEKDLILSKNEIETINKLLLNLVRDSSSKCAILIDQDGSCICKKGLARDLNVDALAALVAGSFASTREMAKLVGEPEFTVLFHQGEKDHIHNMLVDENTILTVIFDDKTTVGMVRLYTKEAVNKLSGFLQEARLRSRSIPKKSALNNNAEIQAGSNLDKLFDSDN